MTEEQMRQLQRQQAQQGLFGSGLEGLLGGSAGQSCFGTPISQQFAQRGLAGSLDAQLFQAATMVSKRKATLKVRDYSEHLIQNEEKILPVDKR